MTAASKVLPTQGQAVTKRSPDLEEALPAFGSAATGLPRIWLAS